MTERLDRRSAPVAPWIWSKAWKVNFWARLKDGDQAFKMLSELIAKSTLPNLFDTHPPFQIDGNFGGTAGIAEMLLQSHERNADRGMRNAEFVLHLLPALPKAWPSGAVKGLCARGGFEVDVAWNDGELSQATVHSKRGVRCAVRYADKVAEFSIKSGDQMRLDPSLRTR